MHGKRPWPPVIFNSALSLNSKLHNHKLLSSSPDYVGLIIIPGCMGAENLDSDPLFYNSPTIHSVKICHLVTSVEFQGIQDQFVSGPNELADLQDLPWLQSRAQCALPRNWTLVTILEVVWE